jgi:hypothetical protein
MHFPFCVSEEESTAHLLLNCPFAQEVWSRELVPWMNPVIFSAELTSLLIHWQAPCPFSLNKKERLKLCWVSLPKFILWKIWLERNARIFKGKEASADQVVAKVKALMGVFLSSIHLPANKGNLTSIEEEWMSNILPNPLKVATVPVPPTNKWEIRLDSSSFTKWQNSLQKHSLFFDRASKGNPSVFSIM